MQFFQLFGNWVDILIIIILLFYAFEGYGAGFIRGVTDFLGFVTSFLIAIRFYNVAGSFLIQQFSFSHGMANALGFFVVAFTTELFLAFLLAPLIRKPLKAVRFPGQLDHLLGVGPGVATAVVLVSFFLALVMGLPLSPVLKSQVANSQTASYLSVQSIGIEKTVNQIFGGAVSEALNFLTIKPGSNETVNLNFKVRDFSIDTVSEQKMFELVNRERVSHGLKPLVSDQRLTELPRSYAKDMFERGYFSHYTPEGLSPFDRMAKADIFFRAAGENLALAPTVQMAHKGLMESQGHRENILSADFGRVGIGVIDGGIYGKMFVQEFTD